MDLKELINQFNELPRFQPDPINPKNIVNDEHWYFKIYPAHDKPGDTLHTVSTGGSWHEEGPVDVPSSPLPHYRARKVLPLLLKSFIGNLGHAGTAGGLRSFAPCSWDTDYQYLATEEEMKIVGVRQDVVFVCAVPASMIEIEQKMWKFGQEVKDIATAGRSS
ncbi:uncharacterized protein RSE6_11599 [Rhynchosporium secalis]|uniref:Uncharacterized protein n=1 Tax=Rhynchosporium secalis TaxID=38038 RepID=A0A1E1MNF3_RHYSE|nr:uncharacterized protein RSE6_11599 [Rhynchosporium secalis]